MLEWYEGEWVVDGGKDGECVVLVVAANDGE